MCHVFVCVGIVYTMSCIIIVDYRVLITAVYKKMSQPELHFFNNCFEDELSKRKENDNNRDQ